MAENVNRSDYLEVSGGHQIYWEDWGNPQGSPILYMHGGPGSGFSDSHKAIFDPKRHHVIFHDQRGAGKSRPFASTQNNTTADLLDDIEHLRELSGLESAHVVGGSWGSALSLMYAIKHPERVRSLVVWSIYLARPFENDWVNEGYPRYNFPAEWEQFISRVPEEHQASGDSIMAYYANAMRSKDPEEARKYAIEWTLWESCLSSIEYDPAEEEKEIAEDPKTLAIALLETHYFMKGCFVPKDYILKNIAAIGHLPCYAFQGRFDMCTPPISALQLKQAYGDNLTLQMVNSGHSRSDPELFKALSGALSEKLG